MEDKIEDDHTLAQRTQIAHRSLSLACTITCKALNKVVALDSTWRVLCLSMPAFEAFAIGTQMQEDDYCFYYMKQ